jgi:hypothetical protein
MYIHSLKYQINNWIFWVVWVHILGLHILTISILQKGEEPKVELFMYIFFILYKLIVSKNDNGICHLGSQ